MMCHMTDDPGTARALAAERAVALDNSVVSEVPLGGRWLAEYQVEEERR
jgi:hypothetical protein